MRQPCANVMAQLDYMEKRGSGLTRIYNETKALEGYQDNLKPVFKSTTTQFQTIIFALTDTSNGGVNGGDGGVNGGEAAEVQLSDRQKRILDIVQASPSVTARRMAEILTAGKRTIERDLSFLQEHGILRRDGSDKTGTWIIIKQ